MMHGMENKTFLTVQEAAQHIGVSESAIRNATLDGRLPFVRLYGRKLIEPKELEAYLRRSRPDGVKPKGRPRRDRQAVAA